MSSESESCRHRAQHNAEKSEWDLLWLLWDWIKPSSFAAYHILLHGLQHFLIFHSGSMQWVVLYPSYFPTSQLSLSSSMSWWCFFFFFWNFSPFAFKLKIKSINQRQWEKDMETEGHLNPFRVPKASEGEINRKLKWSWEWQQPPFRGLKAGTFHDALYYDLMEIMNPPLCISFINGFLKGKELRNIYDISHLTCNSIPNALLNYFVLSYSFRVECSLHTWMIMCVFLGFCC